MSAITTRDALRKALLAGLLAEYGGTKADWIGMRSLDRIVNSLPVIDAATLADDDALVEQVTRRFCEPGLQPIAYVDFTRDYFRALADALSTRGGTA